VIQLLRSGDYLVCGACNGVSLLPSRTCTELPVTRSPMGQVVPGICWHCGSSKTAPASPLYDVYLWLHMAKDDPFNTWPVEQLERLYGVLPGRDIHYTDGCSSRAHLAPSDMPSLYRIWDALLFLSGGEGFGIPAWEAMCSGLPVVYSNYSAHAEYLGKAQGGLMVAGVLQPEPKTCLLRLVADIPQTLQAVRKLYFDRGLRARLGENGRAFVEQYTSDVQAERWHSVFQGCLNR
jgi:glycosyltransferase involved in cell wall biosynthesis